MQNRVFSAKDLGKYFKARRKKLGYTQKQISELSGLSASFISDVENGKPTIELDKAIKLANVLGINLLMAER